MHWSMKYLFQDFKPFGCAEFVEKVLREEFNCNYKFPQSVSCLKTDPQIIKNYAEKKLIETNRPVDGDIVLMDGDRHTCHVGVYVNINNVHHVLHSERRFKVSCLHRVSDLKTYGYFKARFFTWQR